MVDVRLANARDIPQLIALRRAFTYEDDHDDERPEYAAECRRFLETALAANTWRIWVAEDNGVIVAHLFVALIDKVPRPTREKRMIGYLKNVYTVPDHRGQGIGSRLIVAAQEAAAADDLELMIVWPSDDSVTFYARHGFEQRRDPLIWDAGRLDR